MKYKGSIYRKVYCLSFIIMGISFCLSLYSMFGEGESISLEIIEDEYMKFVPLDVRNIWKSGDYLLVVGIPSIDNDERFERRIFREKPVGVTLKWRGNRIILVGNCL